MHVQQFGRNFHAKRLECLQNYLKVLQNRQEVQCFAVPVWLVNGNIRVYVYIYSIEWFIQINGVNLSVYRDKYAFGTSYRRWTEYT